MLLILHGIALSHAFSIFLMVLGTFIMWTISLTIPESFLSLLGKLVLLAANELMDECTLYSQRYESY